LDLNFLDVIQAVLRETKDGISVTDERE